MAQHPCIQLAGRRPLSLRRWRQGKNTGFDTITDGQWVTVALAFIVAVTGTGTVT